MRRPTHGRRAHPYRVLSSLHRILASRRATLVTFVSLIVLVLAGTVGAPQRDQLPVDELAALEAARPSWFVICDLVGLTDVYRSTLFAVVVSLVLYNLCANLVQRLRGLPAAMRVGPAPRSARVLSRMPNNQTLHVSGGRAIGTATTLIEGAGFTVARTDDGRTLSAVRHRHAVIGSIAFHASLILIVIGAVMTARTRIHGIVYLGEGEPFDGASESYASPPRVESDELPHISVTLEGIALDYTGDDGRDATLVDARATLVDPSGERHVVRINEPYRTDGAAMRLVDVGLAPVFEIAGPFPAGRRTLAAKMRLKSPGTTDHFVLPDNGVAFHVQMLDHEAESVGDQAGSHSQEPLARVSYELPNGTKRSAVVGAAPVALGPYRIAMPRVSRWARFDVDRNSGRAWVYAGFVLALLGLTWRVLMPRSWIFAILERRDGVWLLHVAGRQEYSLRSSTESFRRVLVALQSMDPAITLQQPPACSHVCPSSTLG